jgi:hypothetical protein
MLQIIEMRDVVAFELEPGVVLVAGLQDVLDILEAVAEHHVARPLQMLAFPVMLELLVFVEQREQPEIHRTHVQRRYLRLELGRRPDAFLHRHIGAAASGYVHRRVGALLDARQEAGEGFGRLVRLAGLRVARMQMQDRRPGLGRRDRLRRDLVRRYGKMRRHRRRMDRAGNGAGDDGFTLDGHYISP